MWIRVFGVSVDCVDVRVWAFSPESSLTVKVSVPDLGSGCRTQRQGRCRGIDSDALRSEHRHLNVTLNS